MISFKQVILEKSGGQAKGSLEIHSTSVEKAAVYASMILGDKFKELPNFNVNYKLAKERASYGWALRRDMPVITSRDVHEFQNRLQQGFIDLKAPFAPGTGRNPFPTGLSGKQAEQWLENGLAKYDGDANDDRVTVKSKRVEVGSLKPIQKQIYVDKAVAMLARGTLDSTRSFLQNQTTYITSSDGYIIDGHHRYLAAILLNPNMKVQTIAIDLPIKILVKLALAYGDSIGNKRNK